LSIVCVSDLEAMYVMYIGAKPGAMYLYILQCGMFSSKFINAHVPLSSDFQHCFASDMSHDMRQDKFHQFEVFVLTSNLVL
jgi:hypothetical protein